LQDSFFQVANIISNVANTPFKLANSTSKVTNMHPIG